MTTVFILAIQNEPNDEAREVFVRVFSTQEKAVIAMSEAISTQKECDCVYEEVGTIEDLDIALHNEDGDMVIFSVFESELE